MFIMPMLVAATGVSAMPAVELPVGSAPAPVAAPHFPDRIHAFVWRNWTLVPAERMARTVGAKPEDILRIGHAMGLAGPPRVTQDVERRSYITVIRRNWHLLPYDQLLTLLGWTAEKLEFTLREDDFLYVKLGNLKPKCEPLRYSAPGPDAVRRESEIATIVRGALKGQPKSGVHPLFSFVGDLSKAPANKTVDPPLSSERKVTPRFCYSYFALYGDPLADDAADPYPDGFLARLSASGVDGVWMHATFSTLAPFPWEPSRSAGWEMRLRNLKRLVARAKRHGIGIYLYVNEPRSMPLSFFKTHPELKGVTEGDYAALCTSRPEVRAYLTDTVAKIVGAVPDLAGFFTISGSENLTNCWSHYGGATCPNCGKRDPGEVIAELHGALQAGIDRVGAKTRLIAWDWGWQEGWTKTILEKMPANIPLMSVSEWDLPIKRGSVSTQIGEYSVSSIGPGPRAQRHWAMARALGRGAIAKIQANNSWELSPVPAIPAVENVARHAVNLRAAGVDGVMLGWSLGGCPSANLEVVSEVLGSRDMTADAAMEKVARRRYGEAVAPIVVRAWKQFSVAFSEFPFHGGLVYDGPQQMGPANPLWEAPTQYHATMVGFPYDDLDGWRAIYPVADFIGQFEKVADGFAEGIATFRQALGVQGVTTSAHALLAQDLDVAEAVGIHCRSVVNQARFVVARRELLSTTSKEVARDRIAELDRLLHSEIDLAMRLYTIQNQDTRIGFEASNHYFYIPQDLLEKVLNCRDLLDRWLPAERLRYGL